MRASFIYRTAAGVIFASAVLLPAVAFAATGLTIQPVKVDQTLNPGDHAEGTILLTNASDTAVNVEENLDDFVPTAGASSIKFVDRAPGASSVRDWIQLGPIGAGTSTFELALGESKSIPYTIDVPQDAEPGGHFGVIFFKATEIGGTEGSLKVGTQVGMLVLVAIPGNHLEKGRIDHFTAPSFLQRPPVQFSLDFENTGTVHFEPKGEIRITNMFGQEVARLPVGGEVVLPTSIKTIRVDWDPGLFLLGRYTAVATIYDGDGNALTSEAVSFWVIPIWYAVGFFAALIAIYLLLRYLKRHIRISMK